MSEAVAFSQRTNVAAKTVKSVKRPRPLKMLPDGMSAAGYGGAMNNNLQTAMGPPASSVAEDLSEADVLLLMGEVNNRLRNKTFDAACQAKVAKLNMVLKTAGSNIESKHEEFMNSFMTVLCKVCKDQDLDLGTKLNVLEMIERRLGGWKDNDAIDAYYNQKRKQADGSSNNAELLDSAICAASSGPASPPNRNNNHLLSLLVKGGLPLAEDHTAAPLQRLLSFQHEQPTNVGLGPADFLFRQSSAPAGMNGDSGREGADVINKLLYKNMPGRSSQERTRGGTVRFFQPPEGPAPTGIDFNMNRITRGDVAPDGVYKTEVEINGCNKLTIGGECQGLVNTAKQVLEEFFHICKKDDYLTIPGLYEKPISYKREELLAMAKSPLCLGPPPEWDSIIGVCPYIVKREGPTSKHFLREMAEIKKQEQEAKLM